MALLKAKASSSERKFRIELTVKLKKLNETLVIGGGNYFLLIANSRCSEKHQKIEQPEEIERKAVNRPE